MKPNTNMNTDKLKKYRTPIYIYIYIYIYFIVEKKMKINIYIKNSLLIILHDLIKIKIINNKKGLTKEKCL